MKVFNTTDAGSAALASNGMANQAIKVGDTVIPKGGSAVLRGTARERSELQVYVRLGAVAIDELPEAYAAKRGLRVDGTPLALPPPPPPPPPLAAMPAEPMEESPKKKGSK